MNRTNLLHRLDENLREQTKSLLKIGSIASQIRANESPEVFWQAMHQIGLTPEYSQLAIQASAFAAANPDVIGLPIGHFLDRLAGGCESKRAEYENVMFAAQCKLLGVDPAEIDAEVL